VKVSPVEQRPEQNDPKPKSLLSMRDLPKREHSAEMLKNEAQASEAAAGELAPDRMAKSAVNPQPRTRPGATPTKDKQLKFRLSKNDLDAMFGRDVAAQKAIISQRESKKKGIWEEQRERYQSPLENMVPEVRPGNQTALRSRKHPFAQFIATMHRTIHDKWAYNFSSSSTRWAAATRSTSRTCGPASRSCCSATARSTRSARSATRATAVRQRGPRGRVQLGALPDAAEGDPEPNGKVYIHWAFHRDERACGTFGAEPFILDNAGARASGRIRIAPSGRRARSRRRCNSRGSRGSSGRRRPAPRGPRRRRATRTRRARRTTTGPMVRRRRRRAGGG
jgi:hypothetical protein